MEAKKYTMGYIFMVVMMFMMASSEASRHYWVGSKDGWVLKPTEGYSHWAKRTRFHVNDTLIFKFHEGSNSVLVVDKNAYFNCTKTNPQHSLTAPHSEVKLDRSGPFYFISGQADNCEKGQKLEIKVMSPKPHHHHHGISPSLSPQPAPKTIVHTLTPAPAPSTASMLSRGGVFVALGFVSLFFVLF